MTDGEDTKFARWVKNFGVLKLAERLTNGGKETKVGYSGVYRWLRGENEPRGPKLRKIVELARGDLSHQDVHDHFATRRKEADARKMSVRAAT